jgi:hypothetical protein
VDLDSTPQYAISWSEELKGRYHMGDLGIDRRIVLKEIIYK